MKLYEITAHTYENACDFCKEYGVDMKYVKKDENANEYLIPVFENEKDNDVLYAYVITFVTNKDVVLTETILAKDVKDASAKFYAVKDKYDCYRVLDYGIMEHRCANQFKVINGKLVSI